MPHLYEAECEQVQQWQTVQSDRLGGAVGLAALAGDSGTSERAGEAVGAMGKMLDARLETNQGADEAGFFFWKAQRFEAWIGRAAQEEAHMGKFRCRRQGMRAIDCVSLQDTL